MTEARPTSRCAVVGAGAVSQIVHLPILCERIDVEVMGVVDVDQHKAATVAGRFQVGRVMSFEEVLEDETLDAVVLCTPNHLHERQTIAALEAGKHVFTERPLAIDSEGVERILAVAREAEGVLVVGLPHRFRPEVTALKSFVASGDLGDIYAMRGSWLTREVRRKRATWRDDPKRSGGGALMELGIPALDLCLWMAGYPTVDRVSCTLHNGETPVEDAASIQASTSDGAVLSVEVSNQYFAGDDRFYARLMGTEGSGSIPPLTVYRKLGGRPLDVTPIQPRPRGGENPYTNAYRRHLDHFVRAIHGEAEAPLPEEQLLLLRLIEAAYRSADSGEEISL